MLMSGFTRTSRILVGFCPAFRLFAWNFPRGSESGPQLYLVRGGYHCWAHARCAGESCASILVFPMVGFQSTLLGGSGILVESPGLAACFTCLIQAEL